MRKVSLAFCIVFIVLTGASGEMEFETSIYDAFNRAARENKVLMVKFTSDHCPWCDKLEETTLSDERVGKLCNRFIPLTVNYSAGGYSKDFTKQYDVYMFPTIVFIDYNGNDLGRVLGYLEPKDLVTEMRRYLR